VFFVLYGNVITYNGSEQFWYYGVHSSVLLNYVKLLSFAEVVDCHSIMDHDENLHSLTTDRIIFEAIGPNETEVAYTSNN